MARSWNYTECHSVLIVKCYAFLMVGYQQDESKVLGQKISSKRERMNNMTLLPCLGSHCQT